MKDAAVAILLAISSFLGTNSYPPNTDDWQIVDTWQKTTDGYLSFSAQNSQLISECYRHPDHFIEFPTTIHSSAQLSVNGYILVTTTSPDFKYTRSFYGSIIIPCYQVANLKEGNLIWQIKSYSQYFARFKYFPRLVKDYPLANLFNESLNIAATTILLTLFVLYLVLFHGKMNKKKLWCLAASNFFTAFYFIFNSAGLIGLDISMLLAHKIADGGLWLGFLFFIHFLYLEGLILKWMDHAYKIAVLIALSIILYSSTGDLVQLGTTIPFLFTMIFPIYAIFVLIKKEKSISRKDITQMLALFISSLVYTNDIFVVTGLIDLPPLLPVGVMGSYIFILLSVNESIANTYVERDKLKALTRRLKEANLNLTKTQDKLVESEKMAALGRAVARITHELNTPIYLIRSSAQNIETQTHKLLEFINVHGTSDIKKHLEQFQADVGLMSKNLIVSVTRAAQLIKNFKSVGEEKTETKKQAFRLRAYIQQSIKDMGSLLQKHQIQVNVFGDEVTLHSDPTLFYQIIQNMANNTINYAYAKDHKNKIMDIKIKQNQDFVTVHFVDYGKGIPPANQSKIFDAFFTTGGGKGGVGLGLNIVYRIITIQLNGTIKCKSEEGQGATFIINIPLTHDNASNNQANQYLVSSHSR